MFELTITRNDDAVYDVHFKTRNQNLAKKIYQLLLKEFEKEERQQNEAVSESFDNTIRKKPTIELDEPNKVEKELQNKLDTTNLTQNILEMRHENENAEWRTLDNGNTALVDSKTEEVLYNSTPSTDNDNTLFEDKDFEEDYSQYEHMVLGEEEPVKQEESTNPYKMLQSTEEAGLQAIAEEREKAEKRKTFWHKVLYQIAKESPSIYSMLYAGYPIGSDGGTLIVNVSDSTYQIIQQDKRIPDIVAQAISKVVNNSSVSIKFESEGEADIETKLQTHLDAKRVDDDEVEVLY